VYFVLGDGRVSNVHFTINTMEGGWDYSPSGIYHTDGFSSQVMALMITLSKVKYL